MDKSKKDIKFTPEQIELKELIERIAYEEDYNGAIKVDISTEFYPEGWVTVKFKRADEWDEENNQIQFVTYLKSNDRYNELVKHFGKPPIIDFTDAK